MVINLNSPLFKRLKVRIPCFWGSPKLKETMDAHEVIKQRDIHRAIHVKKQIRDLSRSFLEVYYEREGGEHSE